MEFINVKIGHNTNNIAVILNKRNKEGINDKREHIELSWRPASILLASI